MQGLEKILEEIGELRGQAGSECTSEGHYIKKAWEHCLDRVVGIIRKHLNDGWIPVDDRDHMPDAGEHVLVSIGTGFNPEKAFLAEDGRWMMLHAPDGYNDITDEVEAWMPLPDSYRTEDCCGEYKQDWKAGFMQRFERKI
mgnify:CR=1 FL=1